MVNKHIDRFADFINDPNFRAIPEVGLTSKDMQRIRKECSERALSALVSIAGSFQTDKIRKPDETIDKD